MKHIKKEKMKVANEIKMVLNELDKDNNYFEKNYNSKENQQPLK